MPATTPMAALTDPARLAALDASGLAAAEGESVLARVARLAAQALGTPVAQVNVVSADAQLPVAAYVNPAVAGDDPAAWRTPVVLAASLCQHVVAAGAPLLLEDGRTDPAARASEAVTKAGLVGYCAVPVRAPGADGGAPGAGPVIGSVCVVDTAPRRWTPADVAALEELAGVAEIEVARLTAERRLSALADAIPLVLWTAAPDGRTTFLNRRWAEVTGQDPVAALRDGPDGAVHPDDLAGIAAAWTRRLPGGDQAGQDFTFEYRLRTVAGGANGTYRWYLGRVVAERDADGQLVRWVGTGTDIHDQKTAEGALAGARDAADLERRRLAAVLEQLPVAVHVAEAPSGRLVLGNAAVRRVWGADPLSAEIGDYSTDYVGYHPGTARAYASHEWPLARALTAGETVADERVELVRADGTRRVVSLAAAPVRDADGRVVGGVVTSADVTEREQLLAESEAARAELTAANVQLQEQGLELELSNQQLQEQAAELEAQAEELQATAAHLEEQVEATERARAEVAASEAKYRALFASMDQGFCVVEVLVDAAGRPVDYRFLEANPAFAAQTGLRGAAGRTARELVPGLEQHWVDVYGRVAFTGEPVRFEQGSDVMGRWFDVYAFRVGAPAARQVAILFTDVSAARTATREREQLLATAEAERAAAEGARTEAEAAERAAEAANLAKSQFLANMSHELRTPLNAIGGYVQLLDMGLHGPVSADQRGALARVQSAQTRLLSLINDILNYAKLEGGKVEYDVQAVDVADVVRDVAPLVEPQLRAKGLAFAVQLPERPCVVWADREKLGQVLVNLLSNAAKFTDSPHPATGAPGRVTVSVAVRDAGPDGGRPALAFLRVSDTGRGIPRDKQEAIFEPFVQVRSGYAQATEGTGLGLAISRDLARGMGGDLRVRSREGAGSTFTVALRRVVDAAGRTTDRRVAGERRDDEVRRGGGDRRDDDE